MPTKPTRPTATKAPYPKVTPKLPVVYPPLRTPPNTPTKLVQPDKPTLTPYPALRPLMKPGVSGFVSEPNRDPMKQPRFRVGQVVIYSGQGAPIGGRISGWAHDRDANNWYEFSSLIGKIWLPEAALTSKSVKMLRQFKGHQTTITYKGVKVKGVITAVEQRAGRPVIRVKVATIKAVEKVIANTNVQAYPESIDVRLIRVADQNDQPIQYRVEAYRNHTRIRREEFEANQANEAREFSYRLANELNPKRQSSSPFTGSW